MIVAILTIAGLATVFGLILGYSAIRFRVEGDPIADPSDIPLHMQASAPRMSHHAHLTTHGAYAHAHPRACARVHALGVCIRPLAQATCRHNVGP